MAGRPKTRARKARELAAAASPEDFAKFKAAGILCGLDSDTMERLIARFQGGLLSAKGRVKLDDVELLAIIDDRLSQVFAYLDDHTLSKMDGRNLMVSAGILIDKRQLLNDKPTAITQYSDMKKLDDVIEEALAELKRRGKMIDVTPGTAEPVVNPGNSGLP